MNDDPDTPKHRGLNPSLESRTNTSRDIETPARPSADSASVQREERYGWPTIWLTFALVCVLVMIYLIFG